MLLRSARNSCLDKNGRTTLKTSRPSGVGQTHTPGLRKVQFNPEKVQFNPEELNSMLSRVWTVILWTWHHSLSTSVMRPLQLFKEGTTQKIYFDPIFSLGGLCLGWANRILKVAMCTSFDCIFRQTNLRGNNSENQLLKQMLHLVRSSPRSVKDVFTTGMLSPLWCCSKGFLPGVKYVTNPMGYYPEIFGIPRTHLPCNHFFWEPPAPVILLRQDLWDIFFWDSCHARLKKQNDWDGGRKRDTWNGETE